MRDNEVKKGVSRERERFTERSKALLILLTRLSDIVLQVKLCAFFYKLSLFYFIYKQIITKQEHNIDFANSKK